MNNFANEDYLDKIRGCLIGGAAGDALGYPVEFWGEWQIVNRYGSSGITEYRLDPGTRTALISDDTQMTLFTANGLLKAETNNAMQEMKPVNPVESVAEVYQDWLLTQSISYNRSREMQREGRLKRASWLMDVPDLFSTRAPGNTCLYGLKERKTEEQKGSYIERPLNQSKGCGGIMRVAPIGLDLNWSDRTAAEAAAITHGHSLGYMSSEVLARILYEIVFDRKNRTLKMIIIEAKEYVMRIFSSDMHLEELTYIIDKAVRLSENSDSDLNNIHRLGEGWVAEETLAIAIYCALRYQNDFSSALIASVNHKGDSDSTGAVTGNILGAWLGYEAIDRKWKTNLELHDVILEVADDLDQANRMSDTRIFETADWRRKYIDNFWRAENQQYAQAPQKAEPAPKRQGNASAGKDDDGTAITAVLKPPKPAGGQGQKPDAGKTKPRYSLEDLESGKAYWDWQKTNPYYGKKFSVFGDSLSTLEGFNPEGYKLFYQGETRARTGIFDMEDTWWGRVINFLGGRFLMNDSWSGSRVTKYPDSESLFPSGCSDERTGNLHRNGELPDVILVHLGTNDFGSGVPARFTGKRRNGEDDLRYFDLAYAEMLRKLKKNYPRAKIWCCTYAVSFMSTKKDFRFPYHFGGVDLEEYVNVVRQVAHQEGCGLIDLYAYQVACDSIDGSHPNREGMKTMANLAIRAMTENEAAVFLGSPGGKAVDPNDKAFLDALFEQGKAAKDPQKKGFIKKLFG